MSSDGGAATSRIGITGALGLSVTSSVAIVICNKHLISSLGFFFATTLTSWHLAVTFITLYVAQRLRFFEPKPVDAATVVSFGMLNGISIGLLNLCLGFNSVGFYQASVQSIKASVVVLLLGVGISSVTDLQLNLVGSIISALSIVATCVGQIVSFNSLLGLGSIILKLCELKLIMSCKRLEVSSTQLLYQSSPYQSAVLLVAGPFVDKFLTKRDVFAFHYTFPVVVSIYRAPEMMSGMQLDSRSPDEQIKFCSRVTIVAYIYVPVAQAFIVLSCSIAVCVNLCTFLVIGTTSPVTFQVLGHLKTCLVLSFGYVLLRDPFTARNVVGIVIAVFGMGLYSYYSVSDIGKTKKQTTEAASSLLPATTTQMSEKDSVPLLSGEEGSPWPESTGEESFDYVPRTAKSAFAGV
ncbi:hypothetical protein HU200_021915 [Digitaria exilis]|uniref:Sugar phosphate transporter domain-containing protein n=1 Tax=Digitaria exilis TaxID=1010633 RepID=A0A835C5C8_9POAL|nr:hypothetical protein HU200_021915 [Digitaria exilis]